MTHARRFLASLDDEPVRLLKGTGYVVLWRKSGGNFYRMVVSHNSWLPWDSYVEEAALLQLQTDLGRAVVAEHEETRTRP